MFAMDTDISKVTMKREMRSGAALESGDSNPFFDVHICHRLDPTPVGD